MKKQHAYLLVMAIVTIISMSAAVTTFVYNQSQTNALGSSSMITVVDDTGYVLSLSSYPKRIVSLIPSNTEILFAIGAGDRVVGITDYDDYPYDFSAWIEACNITSIGGTYNPAIEPIVALEPDLVLAFGGSGGSLDAIDKLRNLGINVLTLHPKDANGVLSDIQMVGRVTGREDEAADVIKNMSQRITAVINEVKSATTTQEVYVEIWTDPYMSVGPQSWISSLVSLAGGQNIFENATTQYPVVSSETIIQQNPDVMVFIPQGGSYFWGSFDDVAKRTGWNEITAVKTNNMYATPEGLVETPGPRTVDAIEILAKIIHPEIFGSYSGS